MTTNPTSWTSDLAARYELLDEAGRGGMGVVYKARDRETGELVALKVLKPDIAADRSAGERFINEVRLSRRITHKNVCRVYEFSRAGTTSYLSMEFVEGESLRSVLERMGAVNLRKGLQIARQMCAALHEAHSQGIIHRDLKPENVMIDRAGNVKVMDFGIARLLDSSVTATSGIIGTPAYMAPEQAEGRELDSRTDIYSTGLILYELFTGRSAFTGDTAIAVALKQIRETPASPRTIAAEIPPQLETIVMRCLEKDPGLRFQSIEALDAALAAVPTDGGTAVFPAPDRSSRQWPTVQTVSPAPAPSAPSAWRRSGAAAGAALLVIAALAGAYFKWGRSADPIPFSSFTLANGLRVQLSEDHSAPTVTVAVTYNVGARDDPPGREGLAHLFEHMLFNGSLNVGKGEHLLLVSNYGGSPNGQAFADHTQVWETLPANQLDLALFLEADRMRSLRLDEARLSVERNTILAEWQQRIGNQAYGRAMPLLYRTAYDIPGYRHDVLGSPESIQAITLQDVTDFFKIYYAPNNAVLTVVGDFESAPARSKIEGYFQHIPAQPPPPAPNLTEAEQTQERRARFEDAFAPAPRTYLGYKLPPGASEEWQALEVLSTILGESASSRLHQKLVKEMEIAQAVGSGLEARPGPSLMRFMIAPAANRDEAATLKAFEDVLTDVRDNGVSAAEVERARSRIRLAQATALQATMLRALLIGEFQVKYGGADAANRRLQRLNEVTPASVKQVAAAYLKPERRTIVTVVPGGTRPAAPAASAPAVAASAPSEVERLGRAPVSKDVLRVSLPRPKEVTLDNGLTLLVAEDRRVPLVSVRFEIRGAGPLHDPPGAPGTAYAVTAMLREGTASRTSRDIAEQIDAAGVSLAIGASNDPAVGIVQATGLSETFESWLPLVADIVVNASFPADELTQMKRRLAVYWQERMSAPESLSFEIYERAVYGSAAPPNVGVESFASLTDDGLRTWHRERYAPQNTILSVAGAITAEEAEQRIRETLSGWKKNEFVERLPPIMPVAGRQMHVIDRPASVQTSLVLGVPAVDRVHADFLPLVVANRVLGGSPVARLSLELRNARGITFSALSQLNAFKHGGDWRAYGGMNAARNAEAIDGFLRETAKIASEPVPDQELDQAKRSIVASFALTLEQLPQLVAYMSMRRAYGLSADYWDRYPEKIMAVSQEDARRVAAKYMDPARMHIVAVGDASQLGPLLAPHGQVLVYGSDGRLK